MMASASAGLYPQLTLRPFDLSRELVNTSITQVYQDRAGYLWIGTFSALHRFDGYQLQHWPMTRYANVPVSKSTVSQIIEDKHDTLWINQANGVVRLSADRQHAEFFARSHSAIGDVRRIVIADDGAALLADLHGVMRYDETSKQFISVFRVPTTHVVTAPNSVIFIRDQRGRYWYGAGQYLWLLVPTTGTWQVIQRSEFLDGRGFESSAVINQRNEVCAARLRTVQCVTENGQPYTVTTSTTARCRSVTRDRDGRLYALCDGEIYQQRDDTSSQLVKNPLLALNHHDGNGIETMLFDNANILWLARRGVLQLWDIETQALRNIALPVTGEHSAVTRMAPRWGFFQDQHNGMWIFSHFGGLLRANLTHSPFVHWQVPNSATQHHSQMVRAMYDDPQPDDKSFWLATYEPIVWRLRANDYGELTQTQSFAIHLNGKPLSWDREANAFFRDKQGRLWFGTTGGLWRFNEGAQQFEQVDLRWQESSLQKVGPAVMGFVQDDHDAVWVYGNFGLAKLETAHEPVFISEWIKPPSLNDSERFTDRLFQRLWRAQDGAWWLPGQFGLMRFDPTRRQWQHWSPKNSPLKCDWVHAVWELPRDHFWIGTRGCGVQRLQWDAGAQRFIWLDSMPLPDYTIYGMVADAEQSLWLSSDRGLIRLNPQGELRAHYTIDDGLQHNEFNNGQALVGHDGQLYFGGINGVTRVDINRLDDQVIKPIVHIDAIDVTGRAQEAVTGSVQLPHNENSLTVHFVGLHYDAPEQVHYRYRLRGAQTQWTHIGTQRSAHLATLTPGEYHFDVQAAYRNAPWQDNTATLHLVIMPPWWQTGWAYAAYALLLLLCPLAYKHWRDVRERQLRATIADRTRDLQTALSAQERLLAHVSHEFRTPLTLIVTPLQRLAKQAHDDSERRLFSGMQRNAMRLLQLVEQLLQAARAQTPITVERQPFCLAHAVQHDCQAFHEQAEQLQLQLRVNVKAPCLVTIDRSSLATIVYNLLGNAFKFCRSPAVIDVIVSHDDSSARLIVRDNGPGIPRDWQQRIFEPFERVNARDDSDTPGSGLGLYLVREMVRAEGGTISVHSDPGQGCEFTLQFALATHLPTLIAADTVTTQESSPQHADVGAQAVVLIIEDHADLRAQLLQQLQRHFHCLSAATAHDGWQLAHQELPDLIVCDIGLPDESGIALCQKLKADAFTRHIPVFFLTAFAAHDDRLRGLEALADDYLCKPYCEDELLLRISNRLQARALLQQWWQQQAQAGRWQQAIEDIARTDQALAQSALQFKQQLDTVLAAQFHNRELSVDDIARAMARSVRTLQRQFHEYAIGGSPVEYLRAFRLERAADRLMQGTRVHDVIEHCGLDPKRFAAQFKAQFGVLPKDWRQHQHAKTAPDAVVAGSKQPSSMPS